jgi:hypothetical protein
MLGARPGDGRAGSGREYDVVGWVLGGGALWLVSAAGVARILGAVISRADLDDPAVTPVVVPAQRIHEPACDHLPAPRAVG